MTTADQPSDPPGTPPSTSVGTAPAPAAPAASSTASVINDTFQSSLAGIFGTNYKRTNVEILGLTLDEEIAAQRVAAPPATPPADVGDHEVWDRRFAEGNFAVIESSRNDERASILARFLAGRRGFQAIYQANDLGLRQSRGITPGELIALLTSHRTESRCLILEWYGGGLPAWLSHLAAARERFAAEGNGRPYGLILLAWPSESPAASDASAWLEGVRIVLPHSAADVEAPSPPAAAQAASALERFEAIFHPDGDTLDEALAAAEQIVIERSLARIVALFGELPAATFETLVQRVLEDQTISPAAGSPVHMPAGSAPVAPTRRSATEVWRVLRHRLLTRAGLRGGRRVGFLSSQVEEAARAYCWEEPQEMAAVFAAGHSLGILFADSAATESKELFDAYIHAARQLALSDPNVFGARWLGAILDEYRAWLRQTTDLPAPVGDDLLGALEQAWREMQNDALRERLRGQFCQRVGYLSRLLLEREETSGMVQHFFQRLCREGYHLTLWGLVDQVHSSDGFDPLRWADAILTDARDDTVVLVVLDGLAKEVVLDSGSADAQRVLDAFAAWQPAAATPRERLSSRERRALLFVDRLLRELERADGLGGPSVVGLERHRDWLAAALAAPEFGVLAAQAAFQDASHADPSRQPPADGEIFGLALSLYRLHTALPVDFAKGLTAAVLRTRKGDAHGRLKDYWRAFADFWAEERRKLPANDEHLALSRYYASRYELCQRLLRS